MKRRTVLKATVALAILVSSFCLLTLSVFAQPSPGCIFYGYVKIGGQPAPDNVNVTAEIAGTSLSWTALTMNGTYGWPAMGSTYLGGTGGIPGQNPDDSQIDGGSDGEWIVFFVNGTMTQQAAAFDTGGAVEVDLSITGNVTATEQSTLTVSLACSTAYQGYAVNVTGKLLDGSGNGVEGTNLLAAYTNASGQSWTHISVFNTTVMGDYSLEWVPGGTGNYTIRVSWGGDRNLDAAEAFMNVSTVLLEGKYVFSVVSNSTISDLAFNSTKNALSFTLDGPSGTTGFANFTVAKDLISNPAGIKLFLDGNQIDYIIMSTPDSWLLYFNYQQSSHGVSVDLGSAAQPFVGSLVFFALVFGTIAVVLVISCFGYLKFARRKEVKKKSD
jgi:hypothetical protein